MWILAKLLGGQGSYTAQVYHFAIPSSGWGIVSTFLKIIPCVGPLISIGIFFYSFYPSYLTYKAVHKFGTLPALVVTLIPLVVIILIIIAAVVFFAKALGNLAGAVSSY